MWSNPARYLAKIRLRGRIPDAKVRQRARTRKKWKAADKKSDEMIVLREKPPIFGTKYRTNAFRPCGRFRGKNMIGL